MSQQTYQYPYPRRVVTRFLMRQLLRFLLFFLADVQVIGRENVPKEGPCLIVANHFSFLDPPFVVHAIAPVPMEFLAGAQLVEPPWYVKWIPRLYGTYDVIRGGVSRNAMRATYDVLAQDGFMCVFPEAGAWVPILKPARPGTPLIAVESGVMVLPIGLSGVDELPQLWKQWKRGEVTVRIGRPIGPFTAEGRGRKRRAQLDEIGEQMMLAIKELVPPEKHGVFSDDPVLRAEAEEVAAYPFHEWMG